MDSRGRAITLRGERPVTMIFNRRRGGFVESGCQRVCGKFPAPGGRERQNRRDGESGERSTVEPAFTEARDEEDIGEERCREERHGKMDQEWVDVGKRREHRARSLLRSLTPRQVR